LGVAIVASGWFALAEPARSVSATPADYGKGFRQLAALGLPDTSTGTYARLQLNGERGSSSSYALEGEVRLQGNGWVLQAPSNSPGTIVAGQARVLTLWDPKVLARLQSAEARTNAAKSASRSATRAMGYRFGGRQPTDGRVSGTWKPADFTNDLARALAFIEATNAVSRSGRGDVFGSDGEESSSGQHRLDEHLQGPLFLLAAHAWRHGRTNEANRMAAGLFAAAGDPRKVILAALNHLADEQYEQAFERFNATHDWTAFQSDLAGLLQRFPQGWKPRAGVAMLASNVAARATGSAPDVTGEGLTDIDKTLARDMAAVKAAPEWDVFGALWLLEPPSTNASDDVLERLASRKADAIPLLAALADDGWLLPFGRDFLQRWGGYSESWGSDEDADQKARQTYDRLDRPVSRGDIALKLLRQIVLAGDNSYEIARKSPDEIRALALDFHKAHGTESRIGLARLYFAEGSSEQRQSAAEVLLQSTDTNDLALVETQLADAAKVGEHAALLRQYVNVRGAAARPLIQALAVDLGVETNAPAAKPAVKPAANAEETAGEDHGRGQYERREIKGLLALVSDQSLESLLADVAAGKAQSTATRGLIAQRLGQGDREAALTTVLEAATKATNAASRAMLIGYTRAVRSSGGNVYFHSMQMARAAASAKPWQPALARHQARWAGLLADDRHVEVGTSSATVADTAAKAIEELYAAPSARAEPEVVEPPVEETAEPAEVDAANDEEDEAQVAFHSGGSDYMMAYYQREQSPAMLAGMLGARGRAFVLARAKARVGGAAETALPAYPKADTVKPPRRKELTAQLTAATKMEAAGAVDKVLNALSLDERLWLAQSLDHNTNLNARLVPLSLRIVDVTGPEGDAAATALTIAWKGKTLERKTAQALVDYVQTRLKAGESRFVSVERQPSFDGVSIRIQSAADAGKGGSADMLRYFARSAKGLTPAVVGAIEGSSAVWPLTAESAPDATPVAATGASEVDTLLAEALADVKADAARSAVHQQERFWKTIDTFGVNNATVDRTVQLMGVASEREASSEGDDEAEL